MLEQLLITKIISFRLTHSSVSELFFLMLVIFQLVNNPNSADTAMVVHPSNDKLSKSGEFGGKLLPVVEAEMDKIIRRAEKKLSKPYKVPICELNLKSYGLRNNLFKILDFLQLYLTN